MNITKRVLLLGIAPILLAQPVWAADKTAAAAEPGNDSKVESKGTAPAGRAFTTGVAKGRDLLDSAISASALDDTEIEKLGARSLAEVLRTIPGIRAEAASGEADGSYTIRGLPLAASGSKYLQFQEDGLPVLEFGDISQFGPDEFTRFDLNVSQVQTIRGGSASTFASNSPGGVINLISKTGEVEGGAVELSTGLDYESHRIDADYGAKLSDTLRFHVGGFYRQGEGPRHVGYDAYKGGQIKFNITKDFTGGGFVRLYGKYLNDRAPNYMPVPVGVSGSDANPNFTSLANFDIKSDSAFSRNLTLNGLDSRNNATTIDTREGIHSQSKAVGIETQFDVAGWTISEKIRYASNKVDLLNNQVLTTVPAAALLAAYGGAGATLSYATGPNAGQKITSLAGLGGNGLMSQDLFVNAKADSLDNLTNDLRATRTWDVGGGKLTTTVGTYHARQKIDFTLFLQTGFMDVVGDGNSALLDITDALGRKQTQGGIFAFSGTAAAPRFRRTADVTYTVDAPYGSVNYHVGKVSVGGSLRYDIGRARGTINGGDLGGGRIGITSFDINGDGVISLAEQRVAFLPQTNPAPVDYDYHYLSYSTGVNYRFSEGFAAFGRYSRGARAGADRLLFSPTVSTTTGDLVGSKGYDPVKQAEIGVKYRQGTLALNLTGFWANSREQNTQINTSSAGVSQIVNITREYGATGAEFEGSYSVGPFRLAAGATYTKAEIKKDATDATLKGNTPRHQPKLIYSVTPQFETERFTIGANVTGVTSSYSQDVNKLKMPGYATVNAFVQYRPLDRVQLSVNANNLFDTLGLTEITQGTIPATGVVLVRAINGRTVSASARYSF